MSLRRMKACAGQCGYSIGPDVLVCPTCWRRVPMELRKELWRARSGIGVQARLLAAQAIIEWVRENPAPPKDCAKK